MPRIALPAILPGDDLDEAVANSLFTAFPSGASGIHAANLRREGIDLSCFASGAELTSMYSKSSGDGVTVIGRVAFQAGPPPVADVINGVQMEIANVVVPANSMLRLQVSLDFETLSAVPTYAIVAGQYVEVQVVGELGGVGVTVHSVPFRRGFTNGAGGSMGFTVWVPGTIGVTYDFFKLQTCCPGGGNYRLNNAVLVGTVFHRSR